MALTDDETSILNRLWSQLHREQRQLRLWDKYYEGNRRLENLGLAVPPEMEMFTTLVNWPRITVDSVEQRCDVEGFRLPNSETTDDGLWSIWQANDLDEESQMGHLDCLSLGRAYVAIGTRTDDEPEPNIPLITVESAFDVIHELDPRTRRVAAAIKKPEKNRVTLYLPNVTVWLEMASPGWNELDRDEHNLGVVPIVPLLNRPRLRNRAVGVSEMADVITLTDAACRALTNAQVATEVLAVPQRYVIGASPKDFVDEQGNPVPAWETYFGAVWALVKDKDKAAVGQFSAADLGNFEKIVNHYANLVSGSSGLPTRFFGQYTTNPPSEGSLIADETRLITNARRKHRFLGGSWERTLRIARRIIDGAWDPDLAHMETVWRNPETPTRAQTADYVLKMVQAKPDEKSLYPREFALSQLGLSATEVKMVLRMHAQEVAQAAATDPLTRAADAFRTATEPQTEAEPVENPIVASTDPIQAVQPDPLRTLDVPPFDRAVGDIIRS